jgi:CDGSH-type Zn-finger protein
MPEGPEVTVTLRPDGPLLVSGPIKIIGQDGQEIHPPNLKPVVALCRCGGSTNKPFCDGTHSKIGFKGANDAVKQADQQSGGAAGA